MGVDQSSGRKSGAGQAGAKPASGKQRPADSAAAATRSPAGSVESVRETLESYLQKPDQFYPFVILLGLVAAVIWAYWNTLVWTAGFWDDPLYSHGWLIPLFTLALLGMRAQPFEVASHQARWCGLAILAISMGGRVLATHFNLVTVEAFSLVPTLVGVFLLVGGWSLIRWAGPAILFLFFMLPLPTILRTNILGQLQRFATQASTFVIQTLGLAAHRDGNIIYIGDLPLGVVEACSGLRMGTIFLALAVAIVLVVERPWWDRLIILLSALPIALTVNVIRVTVTGLVYSVAQDNELAQKIFHDWAGWFMMPLALGLLYVELQLLSTLVIEDESSPQMATVGLRTRQAPAVPRK